MSRRFITLVLAASTALSLLSTQTRAASNEDVAKIVGGVALLYIISQAIGEAQADDDKDKKKKQKAKQQALHAPQYPVKPDWIERHDPPKGKKAHKKAHKETRYYAHPRTLPPRCRIDVPIRDGKPRVLYAARCLKRHYPAFAAMPAACNIKFTHKNKVRSGFFERCLDRRGYHTPRH